MILAKEKARDLVNSFYYALPNNGGFTGLNSTTSRYEEGIRCALIAVDIVIQQEAERCLAYRETDKFVDYWQEVKQEIQKLS